MKLTRRGQANVNRTCHTGEFESFGDDRCLVALTENFETETRGGHQSRVRVTYDVEVVGTEVYGLVQARVACPRDTNCGPEFFRGECAFQGAVEGNLICTDAGCQPPVCAPQEIIPDEGFADMSFVGDADLSGLCATEVTFSSDKTRLNPGDQTRISWTPTPNTGLVNIYLLREYAPEETLPSPSSDAWTLIGSRKRTTAPSIGRSRMALPKAVYLRSPVLPKSTSSP